MSGGNPNETTVPDGAIIRQALSDPALASDDLRLFLCLAVGAGASLEACARATALDPAAIEVAWRRLADRGYLPAPTQKAAGRGPHRPAARGGQARLHSDLLRRGRTAPTAEIPPHPVVDEFNSERRARPLGTAMASLLGVDLAASDGRTEPGADRFRLWLRTILPPEDAALLISAQDHGDDACRRLARRFAGAEDEAALDSLLEETHAAVARARAAVA
ncbi:MAG: hypothetical protein HKM95_17685 [Inquilinus sp.]|nr:hypothetical protein [Inquilinus sp.]